MAGDWIKMRGNLWDDPRVSRLCDLTDQSEAAIVGGLYWLWATADQHTEDGVMPGLTLRQIDRKTGVPGLGQALCDIGWLADHPDGVRIINFEEHNGSSAKRRATDAQRKANSRSVSAPDADKTRTDDGQNAPLLGAREEKRREEEIPAPTVLVDTPSANRPPACPNAEIVDLYHQRLPTLPRVDVLNDGRKRTIAARWREVLQDPDIAKSPTPREAALEFFDWFFDHASKSKFLTGRAKDWRADIDFLMTPSKFVKVIEGHYHKETA